MDASPHILIAEDEDLVALALAGMLEDHGYRVTVAHNGLEALELDESDPAALLVTDMRMPVMDGNSLIRLIRQRRSGLPIVVMTGYSDSIPREEPGRLVVLTKPFMTGALLKAIENLLQRG